MNHGGFKISRSYKVVVLIFILVHLNATVYSVLFLGITGPEDRGKFPHNRLFDLYNSLLGNWQSWPLFTYDSFKVIQDVVVRVDPGNRVLFRGVVPCAAHLLGPNGPALINDFGSYWVRTALSRELKGERQELSLVIQEYKVPNPYDLHHSPLLRDHEVTLWKRILKDSVYVKRN